MKNTADNMPDIKNFLWGVAISMTIKNKGYDGYASDIRKFNQKIIFSTSNYELLLSENNEQIIYFSKRHNAVLSLEELDAAYQKWRKPLTLVQKISNPIKRVLSGFICQSPDCNDRNRSDVHSLTSLKSRSDDTYASSSPSWRSSKSLKSPLGSVHTVRTVFRARTDFLNSEPDEEYEKTARPKVQNVKNNLKTLAMIAKSRPFENRVAPSGN
jgi:hypothetical protein